MPAGKSVRIQHLQKRQIWSIFAFMEYCNYINEILCPKLQQNLRLLDLFAGCGGLSLGFEAVGFETVGYEMDKFVCETYGRSRLVFLR